MFAEKEAFKEAKYIYIYIYIYIYNVWTKDDMDPDIALFTANSRLQVGMFNKWMLLTL